MSAPRTGPFAPVRTTVEERSDGTVLFRSVDGLREPARSMAHVFREHATAHPYRVLATESTGSSRSALTWGQARTAADSIAQALLERGVSRDRPVMVLSGNSIAHLKLMLGAYTAGVPIVPVSPAYSVLSKDHERLRAIAELCRPAVVFAEEAATFDPALRAIADTDLLRVVVRGERADTAVLAELETTTAGEQVDAAFATVGPSTLAKVLMTSGSTGPPKGVLNSHAMLCANQQGLAQVWPVLEATPPVLVDWLPWSHTFGGNHNLGQVLAFGGTLHIDDGKPAPDLFERTVEALRAAAPTVYYNVPAGYAMLITRLEQDRDFARHFFSRLQFMCYAAAALPSQLWERLRTIAEQVADHPVPLTSSWGMTESAPAATTAHFSAAKCGCVGVPLPGVTVKLAPVEGRMEIRLKGPNVTAGYLRDPEATATGFDEEGFFRTGDAARFVDATDPDQGLLFDGRLGENFKLATGTWVMAGALRTALVSVSGGLLTDVVIAGHDREYVTALGWLNQPEARRLLGDDADSVPRVREHLKRALADLNPDGGSSSQVMRLLLLVSAADLDAGEITDKGYVNQRRVLQLRSVDVDALYAEPPAAQVIVRDTPDRSI